MSAGEEREFIDYLQRKEGISMKCPRLVVYRRVQGIYEIDHIEDCLKEKCALWDTLESKCAILSGFQTMEDIKRSIQVIENKMPHELQFRK